MFRIKNDKTRIAASLIAKSLIGANIYMIPYIQYVYYNDVVSSLGITNAQLGVLLTVYTLFSTLLYIPGGWIVDKTNPKAAMVISAIGTGIVGIWAAFNMNYQSFIIAWILLAFTTNLFWNSASVKAVRMLAPKGAIAKTYALSTLFSLVMATCIGFLGTYLYSQCTEPELALRSVILMYSIIITAAGLLSIILFQFPENVIEDISVQNATKKIVISTLKNPVTWGLALICFFSYSFQAGAGYFTPFFADVYDFNPNASNVFGVIRNYGVAILFVPAAGWLGDKFGSVSKVLLGIFGAVAVILLGVILGINSLTIVMMVIISLIFAAAGRVLECLQWAPPAEAGVSTVVAGVVASTSCVIGYLPDLYVHQIYGTWIDVYGTQGYTYIFMTMLGYAIGGALCAYYIIRVSKKVRVSK